MATEKGSNQEEAEKELPKSMLGRIAARFKALAGFFLGTIPTALVRAAHSSAEEKKDDEKEKGKK